MGRSGYHHGELREALIEAGSQLVAEGGLGALSVAEAARRTEVSAAAPYRHFPNRQALLVAVATRAAEELRDAFGEAAEQAERASDDPAEAIAACGDAYVRFVCRRRMGFDVVFAPELRGVDDLDLRQAARSVIDVVLPRAMTATGADAYGALRIIEQFITVAHGCASLYVTGFFTDLPHVATLAADTARQLVGAAQWAARE